MHFKLDELTHSDTAIRKGIDNTPDADSLANLRDILLPGLERVRSLLGVPMIVSSGYRGAKLNAAIGGSAKSKHMKGLACDFTAPHFGDPLAVCKYLMTRHKLINYDQLINEGRWIHIGFADVDDDPRGEVLTAHFDNGSVTYTKGLL
jgi:zinc D-Ala-D-Ala carboxypeptidase